MKYIRNIIKDVKKIVERIINDENYLFETQLYFKPKEYEKKTFIASPIFITLLMKASALHKQSEYIFIKEIKRNIKPQHFSYSLF